MSLCDLVQRGVLMPVDTWIYGTQPKPLVFFVELSYIILMNKKVLIVEDDMALFNMYSVELKIKGYDVLNVNDGLQALPKTKDYQPDIVLLDIMLPGMNGLNILTELKSDPQTSEIPIIMLTNYGSEDNVKKALESGAADYIMKYKILPSELSDKIGAVLGTSSESDVRIAI